MNNPETSQHWARDTERRRTKQKAQCITEN